MPQVMDDGFARAIASMAIFLEFSDERIVDPDAAVEVLEMLSSELLTLPSDRRAALDEAFKRISHGYGDRAEFVCSLADALWLL